MTAARRGTTQSRGTGTTQSRRTTQSRGTTQRRASSRASHPARPHVIAIINSTPDAVDMLRVALQPIGTAIVSTYTYDIRDGRIDFGAFMRQHRPQVIVYDIAPPYDQNWRLLQHLRTMPTMRGVQFVITSTNARYVQELAGRDEQVYEIIGKPDDLGRIVRAAKEALRARRTS